MSQSYLFQNHRKITGLKKLSIILIYYVDSYKKPYSYYDLSTYFKNLAAPAACLRVKIERFLQSLPTAFSDII